MVVSPPCITFASSLIRFSRLAGYDLIQVYSNRGVTTKYAANDQPRLRDIDLAMSLSQLPVEILRMILADAARVRGTMRALRLRLVCSTYTISSNIAKKSACINMLPPRTLFRQSPGSDGLRRFDFHPNPLEAAQLANVALDPTVFHTPLA